MISHELVPQIPSPLAESSAAALEWPRLRDYLAGRTFSPLGRAWVLALEPSADLGWIDTQHQRTQEIRDFYASGGSFDFHGLLNPTELLDKARIEGSALEPLEILAVLTVVERIAAWRNLLMPQGGQLLLTDLGSSNGSFVRLMAETEVVNGDVLLMGQQLFRVNM